MISFVFMDPRGEFEKGRGEGVTRDVYASFWKEVSDCYLIGEVERVPYVRHDLFQSEWQVIGLIYVKGFLDAQYIPLVISKSFISFCLFGNTSDEDLIASFLNYISKDERELLNSVLNDNVEDEGKFVQDEMLDFLEQFKCRTLLTKENVKGVIIELARQELIQKPFIMVSCWSVYLGYLREKDEFSSQEKLHVLYDRLVPTTKKVVKLLKSNPLSDAEKDALSHFKRYIRGLDDRMLGKLLNFLTGSDIITVSHINVEFSKNMSSYARRPIAHTCGPCLELPAVYNNFCELREDFSNILNANSWEMDIV